METITLKSGHALGFTIADFAAASKLRRVIAAELGKVAIEGMKIDLKDLLSQDLSKIDAPTLNTVKNLFFQLLASEQVEQAVFEAAKRCTLEGQKVTRETFEPENMRGDFLPVAWEVISSNLAPFFGSLDFASLLPAKPGSPAQQ